MKKFVILLAIALFSISAGAQEMKPDNGEKVQKETSSVIENNSKSMSAAELEKCQAKCKADGKKCEAKMAQTLEKNCDAVMPKGAEKKCSAKKS